MITLLHTGFDTSSCVDIMLGSFIYRQSQVTGRIQLLKALGSPAARDDILDIPEMRT